MEKFDRYFYLLGNLTRE